MDSHATPEHAFEQLKKNTLEAIQSYFPNGTYQGRSQKVVLDNLRVDDHLRTDDITSQSEVKDKDGTWGVPIRGDLKLIGKDGKVVDTKKGAILARLPKLTNRYSYIVNGNEYQVDHLFRLKSGIYARVQDNGDLESEFNLAKSPTGKSFQILLDQAKKKFTLNYGDAKIPLYPILKSMGVGDDELEKSWGKEIFQANVPATEKKFKASLFSFAKRTAEEPPHPDTSVDDLHKYVHEYFNGTQLRPDTAQITLGKPYTKVDGHVLFDAAHKLLGVSRGTHTPDDRDSLAFKDVVGVEDFIPEKITRGAGRAIKARLRQTVDSKQSLGEIVPVDLFNRPIHEFFVKGGSVAERSDQTNPIQMLSGHRKTTLMSKDFGGIKSDQSLTQEMRAVNQSHFGFLDPMHTPESERVGITLHLASHVRKNGKDLEIPVYDLEEKKGLYVKALPFHQATAVLPDQVKWVNGKPVPISKIVKAKAPGGDIVDIPFDQARYVVGSAKGLWNYSSNSIPFLASDNGNRIMMADKQMEQAIGLKHREAPLVQSKAEHPTDPEYTYEHLLGNFVSSRSPGAGKVVKIDKDIVHIHGDDGVKHEVHLYNNFPLNDAKGMLHSETLVKPGDRVKKGQVVADNNFTRGGKLAIGTNLRIGYVPYKGYNFEDGIVISESAARKLTSEHLHRKELEVEADRDVISKDKWRAWAVTESRTMPKEHLDALNDDGVIKVGTKVQKGQVLIAAVGKNDAKRATFFQGYGMKRAFRPFSDKSLVWDEDHVGTVTKVVKNPGGKGVRVFVRTDEPAVIGDKLSGRHGNKGIITMILPDDKMPFTKNEKGDKRHLEVLLNPSGVPTRINPGQMLETAAAKIAEKTGKPFIVNNFAGPDHNYLEHVVGELKKHGITDEEQVFDPDDIRRPIGSVLVGPQYVLKLKHQVEKKLTARGGGTDINGRRLPDDADMQPVKGGEKGGQGFGALELYALLGHDARHNIREMSTYKSDQQDAMFWLMVQKGHEPPPPKVPFSYKKFEGLLRGLGVNVEKKGTGIRLFPMNNKEILKLSEGRELKDAAKALRSKDLRPIPGGLFDDALTGGPKGDKWSHIKLSEPMPNPIFVGQNNKPGPVPTLLGMKMKDFDEVMLGKRELHGLTGGKAIEAALKKIDVHKEVEALRKDLPSLRAADLDRANKKLKFLLALKELGMKPHEAYILHNIPVLPPKFRPVSLTPTGDLNYSPLNGHYKNVALCNEKLREHDSATFKDDRKNPIRAQLWDSLKALQSVGNYRPVYDVDRSGNRALKGILDTIGGGEGEQPKEGYFQEKLVKRRQNLAIRSTIIPEPKLGIDEVGIPRNAAMEVYKPYVVAQLGRWGTDTLAAQKSVKEMSPIAFKALEKVVSERPMILKRDPVLHKFGVMAFWPKLVEGKAIQIHPLVTGGYNADFDGDTMGGSVPMSHEAVEEAKKLLPSRNLFSPTNFGTMYHPGHEALLGLHLLSKWGKSTGKSYASIQELEKAVATDQAHVNDVVKVGGFKQPTTLGRILLESRMPRGLEQSSDILHGHDFEVSKKSFRALAPTIAKKHTNEYAKTMDKLKDLGNEWSFRLGFSIGLKDLKTLPERDGILADAKRQVDVATKGKNKQERDDAIIRIYQDATTKLEHAQRKLPGQGHRLAQMVYSGARGDADQLRQMVAAPMLVEGAGGRIVAHPITRSYSEGLDVAGFWMSQHGARKGIIQKNRGTAEPGALTKDIVNASMSTLIVSKDCGTKDGILMDLTNDDIHDRFLATPYKLKDGSTIPAGHLLSPDVMSRLKNSKHEKVLVRSPLKCSHGQGLCSKCFGLAEHGGTHDVGVNIGILSAQAMGEPSAQLSMNAFHSGGVAQGAGAKSVDAITRFRNLLEMPKKIKDEATVATMSGTVTAVKKDAAGGVDVFVDGVRHYVPRQIVNEAIQPGMKVQAGRPLSHGYINPHKLLEATKDIHAVQNLLTNELHDGLFKKLGVRRRNIEVAVRNITNLTKVDDPGSSDWLHGDVLPRTMVDAHNRSLPKGSRPVAHRSILKGTEQIPHLISPDWMQRLNYRELHSTLQQAAANASTSELHGSSPIPGIAYGAEFGRPPAEVKVKKPFAY